MNGIRPVDGESHAWIEVDGIIVDITGDQFDEIAEEVIVTADAAWPTVQREAVAATGRFSDLWRRQSNGLAYGPIAWHLVQSLRTPPHGFPASARGLRVSI